MACISNCPTNALTPGQPIDAPRCISYLTIEKRSVLSRSEAEMIGDWVFGCDECSNVCPPKEKIDSRIPVDLDWLLSQPSGEIRRTIQGNATAYAGVTQLRRNAVAILRLRNDERAKALLSKVAMNSKSPLLQEQLKAW